jgi:hypothetical protein
MIPFFFLIYRRSFPFSTTQNTLSLFVSLVYYAESTVRWFVVREKHCWMAADSADKSKRTGRLLSEEKERKNRPKLQSNKKVL